VKPDKLLAPETMDQPDKFPPPHTKEKAKKFPSSNTNTAPDMHEMVTVPGTKDVSDEYPVSTVKARSNVFFDLNQVSLRFT